MDVLGRHSDILNTNKHREKPTIPELPETSEELNKLLGQQFRVLWESRPVDEHGGEYHPGGVAVTDLEMECPFCGMKFKAVRKSGCFMHDIFPFSCPNCNFPNNVLKALKDLREKRQEETR